MSYKVIRDVQNNVIAYGPNDEHYVPTIAIGCTLHIEETIPAPSTTEQFKAIERAIEQHMDAVAQADGWDTRWTCVARAGYVNPWQAKGIKFAQWMDACWVVAIQAQNDALAGLRTIPTPEQAVLELPVMVW